MSTPSLDEQRVRFGRSSYGWLAGSLQTALEISRIALCVWDSRGQQLPEPERASSSVQHSGEPVIASTLASTT